MNDYYINITVSNGVEASLWDFVEFGVWTKVSKYVPNSAMDSVMDSMEDSLCEFVRETVRDYFKQNE